MIKTSHKIEAQRKGSDTDTMWDTFKSKLLSAFSKFVPHPGFHTIQCQPEIDHPELQ